MAAHRLRDLIPIPLTVPFRSTRYDTISELSICA